VNLFLMEHQISVFWFRRDLRLVDNTALHHALHSGDPVLPLFIFDPDILEELAADDPRVSFIYRSLRSIDLSLRKLGSSLLVMRGDPFQVWKDLVSRYKITGVYINRDYEPYALERDRQVGTLLGSRNIPLHTFKDRRYRV
jgi:deoxyribodipyrimidine photo-lyase